MNLDSLPFPFRGEGVETSVEFNGIFLKEPLSVAFPNVSNEKLYVYLFGRGYTAHNIQEGKAFYDYWNKLN